MLFRTSIASLLPLLISTAGALTKLKKEDSAGGFHNSFRGWTSFPLQAYNHPDHQGYGDKFLTQENMLAQARALKDLGAGYEYLMLDSGWSNGSFGDDHGRLTPDTDRFPDFGALSREVHDLGLKLGVYIVPGAFTDDIKANKSIADSPYGMLDINAPCSDNRVFPCSFLRTDLQDNQASRDWVNSVVKQFAEWQIDLIKFDFIHPKSSPENGDCDKDSHGVDCFLPEDYSNYNDADLYRDAISNSGRQMWMMLSYNLDISTEATERWRKSSDSYRITMDVNNPVNQDSVNGGIDTTVSWYAIQRLSEGLRAYTNAQSALDRNLKGYPDLDSLMIGNTEFLNKLTINERRTYMSLWAISGAPIYLGDDLTKISPSFRSWITHPEVLGIHDEWTAAESPAFYVNPDGSNNSSRVQIWEAGPFGPNDEVVVLLANMGCADNRDRYLPPWDEGCQSGIQKAVATWDVLQLEGEYCVRDVWMGQDVGRADSEISKPLMDGGSVLYRLTPNGKAGKSC